MTNVNEMDVPKSPSNYLKQSELDEKATKIRILSPDFIDGFLDWKDKSPLRYRKEDCPETAFSIDGFVYFWDCIIWNYDEKRVQIFEIKSKVIMAKIKAFISDEDWGPLLDYDLKLTKIGKDKQTKYDVIAANKGECDKDIVEAYKAIDIELESLFEGVDPFKK